MKKYLKLSNILFFIVIGIVLYRPSRIWLISKASFSPSVVAVNESEQLLNYDFQLKGLNTPDLDCKDLKGKVIFLNNWATWCPPCLAEFTSIQNLYKDYKEKVVFIFVTNDDWGLVSDFYKENSYNFPSYRYVSELPEILNKSNSIPSTYVIDKHGKIRVYKVGAADWYSKKFKEELDSMLK